MLEFLVGMCCATFLWWYWPTPQVTVVRIELETLSHPPTKDAAQTNCQTTEGSSSESEKSESKVEENESPETGSCYARPETPTKEEVLSWHAVWSEKPIVSLMETHEKVL